MELADPAVGRRSTRGIETVVYAGSDIEGACETARSIAVSGEFTLMVALFDRGFDAGELARRLKREIEVPTQVCASTAGGVGPFGYVDGCIIFVFFSSAEFEVLAELVPAISSGGLEQGTTVAGELYERFENNVIHRRKDEAETGKIFALTLIDGLSNHEEVVVAAIQRGLPNLPLVGGSAGDGLAFENTYVCLDGRAHTDAAVVCLIWTKVPFAVFKSDHYRPTDVRLVVTGCDPEKRLVTELNGIDAATEYASVLGLDPQSLTPFSFAAHPLTVRVGGEHYCRSIRRMEPDGLSFFCAIEEGVVLTIAEANDMIDSMRGEFDRIAGELGGIDLALGFDCILRRIEAEERQLSRRVAEVFDNHNVIGFTTYGEQFSSMHLNQTLTGIAFGAPAETTHKTTASDDRAFVGVLA
ncbi:FIST N-terminal domain-containing protein [Fulvimarina sp. MAC8]|uniref:FIST N-terminal domain-containing protein n=1 Tax=Fulvimarina sp. MAC8 TaxID=3162874 RepID=UPI0032EEC0D7